jgi:hypothetical protein
MRGLSAYSSASRCQAPRPSPQAWRERQLAKHLHLEDEALEVDA